MIRVQFDEQTDLLATTAEHNRAGDPRMGDDVILRLDRDHVVT